jgi:dTDP-4-amino-4,6-dideoxygalactose transaminase
MNNDPWSYVNNFEKALGEYTGAPYVITTDCATHAMELCLRYLNPIHPVQVPKHTYLSVPMMVEKIGAKLAFMDTKWEKYYQLNPYPVIDGSVHFEENCYVPGTFYCLSFQHKKRLN